MENFAIKISERCGLTEQESIFLKGFIPIFKPGQLTYEQPCIEELTDELIESFQDLAMGHLSYTENGTTTIFSIIDSFRYIEDKQVINFKINPHLEKIITQELRGRCVR